MLKIGIRGHDCIRDCHISEFLRSIKKEGFYNVQLVLNKTIVDENGELDERKAEYYQAKFEEYKVNVVMLGAYFNPVHSDKVYLERAIEHFKNHLKYARRLGTQYVGTETGSYNDDKWTYNPLNHTEEAYQVVLKTFKELALYAKEYDSTILLEGAYNHVIYEPKLLKRLVDEINENNVKVIIDLYNYLNIDNYEKRYEIFNEALELLKDKIVLFHLKDYIVDGDKLVQVGLGQGLMNYPKIIKMIKDKNIDAYLIFEGVTGLDIAPSLELIKSLVEKEDL